MTFQSSVLTILALSGSSSAFAPIAAKPAFFCKSSLAMVNYVNEIVGEEGTEDFRIKFRLKQDGGDMKTISPWHDIPLKGSTSGTYNMIVEIPKMSKAKMEVATKEENNPIAQDLKKGKLRDYHGPIFWNYGCLPQTWEDPSIKHPELGCFGDDDPIDVVEIGKSMLPMGTVKEVKPLGILAMIDDGELDWKIVAVAKDDPLAEEYNDIDDVPAAVKDGIREWFRWYKTPDGKPLNSFGFDEKFLDVAKTKEAIQETNNHWMKLKADGSDKLWVN